MQRCSVQAGQTKSSPPRGFKAENLAFVHMADTPQQILKHPRTVPAVH